MRSRCRRSKELDHDFLWRSTVALPERGRIGIFNRSYYEELIVVRVHPEILAKQRIPSQLVTKNIWRERFEDISAFERYLSRNGTLVLKFFLNVSKEEQRQRFLERLEEPAKWWKFSMGDVGERGAVGQVPGRLAGRDPQHGHGACALACGAGRPQVVRAGGHQLDHRPGAGEARSEIPAGRQEGVARIRARAPGAGGGGAEEGRASNPEGRGWPPIAIRQRVLTLFWHCRAGSLSAKNRHRAADGNEPSTVCPQNPARKAMRR